MGLSDEELFAAFTPEQAENHRKQARERWGEEQVALTEERLKQLSKDQWDRVQEDGGLIAAQLASLMAWEHDHPEVQRAVARHHAWIENFYPASAEVYRGLAQMYAEHPEFRAYYDGFAEGLAVFMHKAMTFYAESELS